MKRTFGLLLSLLLMLAPFAVSGDSAVTDFESGFTAGNINGQNSWTKTGAYDVEVVATSTYASFGTQSLRISNAVTSGAFGDQTFAAPLADSVGETAATAGSFSAGTKFNHYELQFDIASVVPTAQQAGLVISVSPDRGDGSRMSYLRFEDGASGIDAYFYDVQGSTNPADFEQTQVASALDRSVKHTVKLSIDTAEGAGNDIVKVWIDGSLVHVGTSWENYYRFDSESSAEQSVRIVKTVLFRAGGTAVPTLLGGGFLFDNISQSASNVTLSKNLVVNASWAGSAFGDVKTYGDGEYYYGISAFSTITDALKVAQEGAVITVLSGTYAESPTISTAVTLTGVSASITGQVTVSSDDVTIEGFSISNPGGQFGILMNGVSDVTIQNNAVSNVGTGAVSANAYGIYFQDGVDDASGITISNNTVNTVGSSAAYSNGGIGIGDSTGASEISGVAISGNTISGVTSGKGAYGVIMNHAKGTSGNEGTVSGTISGNNISNLSGKWAHAIGLEGGTPELVVSSNTISGLTSSSVPADAVGITFEDNSYADSVEVSGNDVDLETVAWGVVNKTASTVDVSNNFWHSTDPAPQLYQITPVQNVLYKPFALNDSYTSYSLDTTTVGATTSATVSFECETGLKDVSCSIPSGTEVSGGAGWDGTFTFPVATRTYTIPVGASAIESIELGAGDTPLYFSKPVQIVFEDQAGKRVGWSRNGVFTEITTVCSGEIVLPFGGDCKKDQGSDLVVYTRHATSFTVFTPASGGSSSGGGGGGNGPIAGSYGGNTGSIIPTYGQVLGASTSTGATTPATGTSTPSIADKGVCAPLITVDLRMGRRNPVDEVKKLQQFLNKELGLSLPVTGFFGVATDRAVKQLQEKYRNEILGPAGAPDPTGLVLQFTRALINARNCMTQ